MDFAINTELLAEVEREVKAAAKQLESDIDAIYDAINSFNSNGDWVGSSYNAFKERCENFRPSFNALVTELEAFANIITNQINGEAEEKITKISDALQ